MPSPWWMDVTNGYQESVGLIQFDLGGHSLWADSQEQRGSVFGVYESRKELQQSLQQTAEKYGIYQHHWAGDGGLFAAIVRTADDADRVCKAMSEMYDTFDRWQRSSPSRDALVCRITGTRIPDVCIDKEPGNWYSAALNQFLKFERYYGFRGTIRITQELRKMLRQYLDDFSSEESKRTVVLPNGISVPVFQDRRRPIQIVESTRSFRHWLNKHSQLLLISPPRVTLPRLASDSCQVGDSVILNSSVDEVGYRDIYLKAIPSAPIEPSLFDRVQDYQRWDAIRSDLSLDRVRGTKLRVHSFRAPLNDDPLVRLEASQGSYVDSFAFHALMLERPELISTYSLDAEKVAFGKTWVPNTLSNHAIVVLGGKREPELLLCHRRRGSRPGGYTRNCWSASFEEQFNPIEDEVGGKILSQDHTVEGSIRRGLVEEIVGADYDGPIKISIHAFQMEAYLLNFGFLALVELPELSFDDVTRLWRTAGDADEHDVLAAMPLQERLILNCIASQRLPLSIFSELRKSASFSDLSEADHAWHPTSLARLVLSLWYIHNLNQ